jgi:hypothetical protein
MKYTQTFALARKILKDRLLCTNVSRPVLIVMLKHCQISCFISALGTFFFPFSVKHIMLLRFVLYERYTRKIKGKLERTIKRLCLPSLLLPHYFIIRMRLNKPQVRFRKLVIEIVSEKRLKNANVQ